MVEKILPGLYRVEIPIPNNPLKALNSYFIISKERNLIIDTGMNRPECRQAMEAALEKLGVDLCRTDLFITHMHVDHSGLVNYLTTDTSRVYCSEPDALIINGGDYWDKMREFARISGFPQDEDAIMKHPGYKYASREQVDFTLVTEGDRITVGDYTLQCIATPGHTKGHLCLYEADKKLFFSGDHILYHITPNISLWADDDNPLKDYLDSLDKVYQMDIKLVLPGHRKIFEDYRQRIGELIQHHCRRALEIVMILEKEGPQNPYSIASRMKWDLSYDQWEQFPIPQQWFATGEVIAHLKYLEDEGKLSKELAGEQLIYRLLKNRKAQGVMDNGS